MDEVGLDLDGKVRHNDSMFPAKEIEKLVAEALPGAKVVARDLTGGADHYELTVVTEVFEGLSLMERHRMVYAPLAEPMKGPIHALTLKTQTPAEAKRRMTIA